MTMERSESRLVEDARAIWRAGVAAVDSKRLVLEAMRLEAGNLFIEDACFPLQSIGRIVVVGAGKAGAGMAEGVLETLGPSLVAQKQLEGFVNVPADCVRACGPIHLHAARPAGVNEPTLAGVAGAEQILRIVDRLEPTDLCLCLLSGGGSALLPAPKAGITLEDKQIVTRWLSGAGANIEELNTVRKQLSAIKGGGLRRRCRGLLATLVISDVIGDPLDVIASGPTTANTTTAADALEVLSRFDPGRQELPEAVYEVLERAVREDLPRDDREDGASRVSNHIIGNNAAAVDAAGIVAERRGYSHAMWAATALEGAAEEVGRGLAEMAVRMRDEPGPDCLITGGEPTVSLAPPALRGKGGRNQQLVLAAAERLLQFESHQGVVVLSGGTDGEDGPTDAAGGWCDEEFLQAVRDETSLRTALDRNDAYPLLEKHHCLLKTGPTHTNVCDLRVVVVKRVEARPDPPTD